MLPLVRHTVAGWKIDVVCDACAASLTRALHVCGEQVPEQVPQRVPLQVVQHLQQEHMPALPEPLVLLSAPTPSVAAAPGSCAVRDGKGSGCWWGQPTLLEALLSLAAFGSCSRNATGSGSGSGSLKAGGGSTPSPPRHANLNKHSWTVAGAKTTHQGCAVVGKNRGKERERPRS
eukprot:871797-Rhodomonas_salina.1